jgi:hypothetical protein
VLANEAGTMFSLLQIGSFLGTAQMSLGFVYSDIGNLWDYATAGFAAITNVESFVEDSQFTDAANRNFSFSPGSPCINQGNPMTPLDSQDSIVEVGAEDFVAAMFLRGDANQDGNANLADAIYLLNRIFSGGGITNLSCQDAADVNDDGAINLADAIYLLNSMFVPGSPAIPGGGVIGPDPSPDSLSCG